jgi:hypothetical protein
MVPAKTGEQKMTNANVNNEQVVAAKTDTLEQARELRTKLMAREANEVKMFGCTERDLFQNYGPDSFNWKGCGSPMMLVASMASDAQELLGMGDVEQARQLMNRVKWVIFQNATIEADKRTARETAEREAKELDANGGTNLVELAVEGFGADQKVRVEFASGQYVRFTTKSLGSMLWREASLRAMPTTK